MLSVGCPAVSGPPEYVPTINMWISKGTQNSAKCLGGFLFTCVSLDSNSSFVSSCNGVGIHFEWLKGFKLIMPNCNDNCC